MRESRAITTVHQDLGRAEELTWLTHCVRRADRKWGGVGTSARHFTVDLENGTKGNIFLFNYSWLERFLRDGERRKVVADRLRISVKNPQPTRFRL